jgi:hypothetical protein
MTPLDPQLRSAIDAYFEAMNARDEAAFASGLAEGIVFFGSMGGVRIQGVDAARGMFQALGERFPGLRQEPGRTFGPGPEVAVQVDLSVGEDRGEGIWIFRFDGRGRIERVSALYDPRPFQIKRARAGAGGAPPEPGPDTPERRVVEAYFATFNSGDEEAHMRLFDPEVHFFGSLSRIDSAGLATVRGVHHAARASMGVQRLELTALHGRRQEVAALLRFTAGGAGPSAEGVWAFRINGKGLIERLSALWNPAFLPRRSG